MFLEHIQSHNPGDKVEIDFLRDEKPMQVYATIGIWKGDKECVLPYKDHVKVINQNPSFDGISKSLDIYPIPATDQINISFHSDLGTPVKISMMDVSGKELFSEEINDAQGNVERTYSVDQATPGLAVIHIQQGEEVLNKQILIQ